MMDDVVVDRAMTEQEIIDHMMRALIRTVEKTTSRLYKHTIDRLKTINPTLEELAEWCDIFIVVLEGVSNDQVLNIKEVVQVLREAASALHSGNEKMIVDCAYHLEDVIGRVKMKHTAA